jgi:hypothetical protein
MSRESASSGGEFTWGVWLRSRLVLARDDQVARYCNRSRAQAVFILRIGCVQLLVLALVSTAGCTPRLTPWPLDRPLRIDIPVALDDGGAIALHLSEPVSAAAPQVLLLYATGDGGWRGKDKDAFEHMTRWGYAIAGFSSKDYLRHLERRSEITTPQDVARDFALLIEAAKLRFGLADNVRTILVGVSRGAGLSVAAAGRPSLQHMLAGVLLVALTREEEYVHRIRRRSPLLPNRAELVALDTYDYLRRLGSMPVVIIQSTHDNYLPAAEARTLIGPDSELLRLEPVASKNHSFTDARGQLYDRMQASLGWIARLTPSEVREGIQ